MPQHPRTARALAVAATTVALALTAPTALAAPAPTLSADADPVPALVAGQDTATPQLVTGLDEPAPGDPVQAARAHLAAHPERYRIDTGELTELASTPGPDGRRTVRFEQRHGGIPVLGGQYLVHLTGQGAGQKVESAGGRYFTGLTAPTTPAVPAEALRRTAIDSLADPRQRTGATAEDLGAVVLPGGPGRLTEHYTVRPADGGAAREVYVDATAGTVALTHDARAPRPANGQGNSPVNGRASGQANSPANGPANSPANGPTFDRKAAQAPADGLQPAAGTAPDAHGRATALHVAKRPDGTYQLTDLTRPAAITTYDAAGRDAGDFDGTVPGDAVPASSPTPDFPAATGDDGATDAHVNAGIVYDFYRDRLGRDGLDGQGGPIVSVVNVSDHGGPFANAFWDGRKMVYGALPGRYPFSAALDVSGHEMTHAVIDHTANLVYFGQSGAMNEALADYFGNAIEVTARGVSMDDPTAPLLGESLCRTGTPQECADRRLDDHRTTVKDFLGTLDVDAGGVHLNSTIFGGALWDVRRALDPLTADRVVYHALADYLTPTDDFLAGRNAVLAAGRAQGLDARQLRAVAAAFDAHGIRAGWQQRLGTDARTLLTDIPNSMSSPVAANGHWVILTNGPDGNGLYTGTVDGRGKPVRLSPQDGRFHSWAATDGTTAVWEAQGGSGGPGKEVLTAPLSGAGPVRSLLRTTDNLDGLQVSGPDIAYALTDTAGRTHPYLIHDGAPAVELPLPAGHGLSGLTLRDGLLGWTETWQDGGQQVNAPTVYSVAAGKVTAQYTAHAPAGSGPSRTSSTLLAGGRLVWLDTPADPAGRSTIRSGAVDGSGIVDVLPASSPQAPRFATLTASDQAVSYQLTSAKPAGGWTNAAMPKLWQVPLAGGEPRRISCDRGGQYAVAADRGTRVVWLDATAGRADLVTRERPAGGC
ncbi:M4 family metallopeptidase [Kitasatospora sp. NPDC127059]|uniref:M4 family metallopeptidase n=1 Tax=unclassified Kitasatospora TaxID=2633591 RepID=UPI003659C056